MNSRSIVLTVALLASSASLLARGGTPAQSPQDTPGRIRVAVDVVAVDVQAIDRDGRPVPDLGPEKFTVTINGRKRKVISAERIGMDSGERAITPSGASVAALGRVIILAVDCSSFDATASRGVMQAVQQFLKELSPEDFVGLHAYPNGAMINPTKDHAAIARALDTVVGQRDLAEVTQFHVRPSEIVDVTRDLNRGGGPTLESVAARECGQEPPDPYCRQRFITDVSGQALYFEGQATASLGMLRTIVANMSSLEGRKTLILISGGMLASDGTGGRPDLGELGIQVGKEAAKGNTTIYTLYIETNLTERFSAQTRSSDRSLANWSRDSSIQGRWLEQFSGAAGGALFTVQVGNAERALERIKTELTSYYLLGVEPADEDRDGRTHEVSVKTTESNVTVRGRRWVMVPRRSGTTPNPAKAAKTPDPEAATPAPAAIVPPKRVIPPEVQSLADTFERGNYDAVQRAMMRSTDLANTIRAFRMSDAPWPDAPKKTAVFALEMALAGLRSDNTFAREEGGRLLAEYHTRVRQPSGPDPFECLWFVTEASALEGLFLPESAMIFIPRAVQRCPNEPRLRLAYAFVTEQQWMRGGATSAQDAEVVKRYEDAMKSPDTDAEARVRAARFLNATGNAQRALEVLTAIKTPSPDREVRYFTDLVRGQVLRSLNRPDEATAAFRAALVTWPDAQSARVALMTLLVNQGKSAEAGALAEAAQTAPPDDYDPWWTYWLGDFRTYPATLDKLRAMGR
jgi:VWFA-related protein